MNDPTTKLRCEISSLQAQLACEKQEKQKLHDTVVLLSSIVSEFAKSSPPVFWNPTGSQSILSSDLTRVSSSTDAGIREASRVLTSNADGTPDLIDLTSFGTNSTEALTDSIITQAHRSKDKPPILDLEFKGLRTSHDGPEKTSSGDSSFDSRDFTKAPSFEEIYGKATHDGGGIHEVSDAKASDGPVGEDQNISVISNSKTQYSKNHFGQNNLQRSFLRGSAWTDESVYHNSDFCRPPMSRVQGIRFDLGDKKWLNRDRVLLLNLPNDISLSTILSKIRGGTVVSCELLDTRFAYGSPSAMVRFSSYAEAMFCVDQAATMPLAFDGRTARMQLIPTPSYPLAPEVYKDIFEHGHTRCLRIARFAHVKGTPMFRRYRDPQYIEFQTTNTFGDWIVRFTSLQRASALWATAQRLGFTKFGGGFMLDPCAVDAPLKVELMEEKKNIQVMPMVPLEWKI